MIISLINHSEIITDEEVQQVVRAINRQLEDDFEPYWSFGATLRLEGAIGKQPSTALSEMRGDAVLYLVDGSNALGALGATRSPGRRGGHAAQEIENPSQSRSRLSALASGTLLRFRHCCNACLVVHHVDRTATVGQRHPCA